MGAAADHEGGRQRIGDQVLSDPRRSGRAGDQRLKDQVHIQRRRQVQGRASQEERSRCETVRSPLISIPVVCVRSNERHSDTPTR